MNAYTQTHPNYEFIVGLITGTFIGAGLAMWLAPQSASELRERLADSAESLGRQASGTFEQASARLGQTVDELTRTAEVVRHNVAEAVARGAHELGRHATAAKSEGATQAGKHAAADRSASGPHSL